MEKIIVLNYNTGTVTVVTITEQILVEYNHDIDTILTENCTYYNESTCYWMSTSLDEFGNFKIEHEYINERKS